MLKKLFTFRPDEQNRVFGLDVLRAIAVLTVVDAHAAGAMGQYAQGNPLHQVIPDGVELFFVLSGFLIGGILIKLYEREPQFNGRVVANFWTRRWFRTLPAYYLVLAGLVAWPALRAWRSGVGTGLPPKPILVQYLVFLQNFNHGVYDFFPETWSLAIEEWSYLLLPVLLIVVTAVAPKTWPKQRVLLTVILLVIVGTNAGRLIQTIRIPITPQDPELGYRGIVLSRLDAIAYGVLAAWIRQYRPQFWTGRWAQQTGFWLGIILTVIVSFTASIFVLRYYVDWGVYPLYVLYKRSLYFLAIGLSMMLLVPRMSAWKTQTGWFVGVITHISLISYSMYLLNLSPILGQIISRIPTPSASAAYGKLALFWGLSVLLPTLVYRFYEKPMTMLRDRFSKKEPHLV
jgi:peptidoglycan/LPS O-acetylase OafA/YrhL